MDVDEFFKIMNFPQAWIELDMYPPDLAKAQADAYQAGNEDSSEHDRNGAFHWWLAKSPDKDILLKLLTLTMLDPDQLMAADVRRYIEKSKHADDEVIAKTKEVDGS